ncbi:hypothetical protein J3F80_004304 [Coemansia sp. RSA 2526]|nr:hypothetical protein J3F80_004304 [Coemansia sp. RSA 2526]
MSDNRRRRMPPELRASLSSGGSRASLIFQQLHESVASRQSVGAALSMRRSMTTGQMREQWWSPTVNEHIDIGESESELAPLLAQSQPGQKTRWQERNSTGWKWLGYVVPLNKTEQTAVFKAVLAYAVAGLFPFVGALRDWLGDPEYMSPHLVTNATIWYHAAKSRSGLAEGGLVGALWVSATSLATYAALCVAEWLHQAYAAERTHDGPDAVELAIQSKAASLAFIFMASWCLAFFKANAQRPSVGTATAIANISLYLVMLREAPIVNYKDAHSSFGATPWPGDDDSLGESVGKKTEHVLVAVLLGMVISLGVGWVVRPATAGTAVRRQLGTVLQSFRSILPQLVSSVVRARMVPAAGHKHRGAKSGELKEALRAHRTQQQKLRREVDAVALDPSVWSVWARRNTLVALAAALDGLSLHLGSMGAALELRANGAAGLDAVAYSAVIQRIRMPVEQLVRVADATLSTVRDMVDTALAGSDACDTMWRVARLREDIADALCVFQAEYDTAVCGLADSDDGSEDGDGKSAGATEEQLFVVYFFVSSLREFVGDVDALLPCVAAVCREPPAGTTWSVRLGLQRAGQCWRALWDTGATTALEAGHEGAQFSDPRALHWPRPTSVRSRMAYMLWKAGMWVRRANVRFATKYALLATALAVPWYWSIDVYLEMRRQRLEWAVISAAAIMVPTVGGSALVSVYRVLGTCAGGLAAFLVYEVGQDMPLLAYVLMVAFAIPCFHIMLHGRYPRIGQFALITFGVVLINKYVAREDQLESAGELAVRRTGAVALGVVAGMMVTMYVWPFEARVRVRQALSWWLLTASLLYGQLWSALWRVYADTPWRALRTVREYFDSELQLQDAVLEIRGLLADTLNEPRLKGRFPVETYEHIINASQRLLDALVAARRVMLPVPPEDDMQQSPRRSRSNTSSSDNSDEHVMNLPLALSSAVYLESVDEDDAVARDIRARVERDLLQRTASAREHRDALVSLTMYVLASALVLKTPLPAALPPVREAQQRVADAMGDVLEPDAFNDSSDNVAAGNEHELKVHRSVAHIRYVFYYTQVMLGWEIVHELAIIGGLMRELYGSYGS